MSNEVKAARSIYERWIQYVEEARGGLPNDASLTEIIKQAIVLWRQREPPELAFVADELSDERRETQHETAEDELFERVARGEIIAVRPLDGEARYLTPEEYGGLTIAERAKLLPYDPLLARAIRRHALDEIVEFSGKDARRSD
ncbi:MAG: hypothetical protein O2924_01695 [Chloroflexi bacterium]|nr:hypothetical protein [Chloroflexota bacterium]